MCLEELSLRQRNGVRLGQFWLAKLVDVLSVADWHQCAWERNVYAGAVSARVWQDGVSHRRVRVGIGNGVRP